MKRKYLYLLLIVSILIIPINAKAATGSVDVSCLPTTVSVSENNATVCTIKASVDGGMGGASMDIASSGSISVVSINKDSAWTGQINEGKLAVHSDSPVNSLSSIATVNVKAAAGASIGSTGELVLSNIELTDSEGNAVNVDDKKISLTIGETSSNPSPNNTQNSANSSNPKTMDTNVVIITMIVALATGVVIIGKKKLDKISK